MEIYSMNVNIRPFRAEDYEAVGRLFNAAYADAEGQPILAQWPQQMREVDEERPEHVRFLRLVAEVDGEIVGVGEYDQDQDRYDPRKFLFDLYVHPARQRQGIGGTLYNRLLESMAEFNPLSARTNAREDLRHSVEFLERRGWREAMRTWESFLDVAGANLEPFLHAEEQAAAAGITIRAFGELAGDPERERKLYDLEWEIRQDLPDLDAATRATFEEFQRRLYHADQVMEAFFVALDGDRYVGYLTHRRFEDTEGIMKVGTLGILPAYRGKGIAKALKLREVLFARANGIHTIRTTNESNNRAVLSINERMGFEKRPAWLDLVKEFAAE